MGRHIVCGQTINNLPYEKCGDEAPVCIADEVPFDIPDSWEWVRLESICEYIQRGKSPKYSPIEKYPVIAQKCNQWSGFSIDKAQFIEPASLSSYGQERFLLDEDLMWNSTGLGTLGRMAIYRTALNPYELAVADSHVTVIRPVKKYALPTYLYFYFANPSVQKVIEDQADGSTKQKELATATIKQYLVPLPPLNEQQRILAKLAEVLPAIGMYDAAYTKSEQLQNAFPGQIKKSILQMAVQGKLVPQDPSDEPAEALLTRIWEQKEQLIKEGKIKRDKHESIIFRRDNSHYELVDGVERCIDDEIPFEIPENWAWCRLTTLVEMITSGSRDWAQYYSASGAKFLRMGNLSRNSFSMRLTNVQHVSLPKAVEGMRTSLQAGDLLFSITGDVGLLGVIPEQFGEAYTNQHTAMIRFIPTLKGKYLPYVLLSDYAQKQYKSNQHGIKNSFRLDSIGELLVPVPPLKEQARIVHTIEQMVVFVGKM